jgi:hypothetical protein
MKKINIFISIIFILTCQKSLAQGCVAIRGLGAFSCATHQEEVQNPKGWTFTMNNRYFKSYKHFVGMVEQKERVENGTEVINHSFSTDLFLQRHFNQRMSFGFNLPVISNARSSMYEHGGNTGGPLARRSTHSFGIGDARIAFYYWLMDPLKKRKWNLQVGTGVKLATGDYNYQDYFYKNDTTKTLGSVDQSIQLGDGGTGLTLELNGYYTLSKELSIYGNFFYLSNPREQNGVSTARGGTPTAASISYGSNVMSVPDQYMYRAGFNYMKGVFTGSLGLRKEGLPAKDLIGGSNGFRRPGYVVSVEPGISIEQKKLVYFFNLPIAIQRNRTQSAPDIIRTQKTGVYFKGDAAFADYLINVGMVIRL